MNRFFLTLLALFALLVSARGQALNPQLSIRTLGAGQVQVAWPSSFPGFTLEIANTLAENAWQPVSSAPVQGQTEFFLTISASRASQFLRLRGNASGPVTTIASTSPVDGETGVAVTRETIVTFSAPLSSETVLSSNTLYATFGGRRILSRLELSSDRRRASLFYLEPLPGSARIEVTFDGDQVEDTAGNVLDGDGDGTPGGAAIIAFNTLNLSELTGTAVVGTVYASEVKALTAAGAPVNQPLEGVTITVDGREQELRAVTDAQGKFVLSPVPPGRFFVKIDGRTARGSSYPGGAYYPYVGKAWDAIAGKTNNPAGETGEIFLPLITPGTLQSVSATSDTSVSFPASVLASNPSLVGVSVTVPANSLFNDNGTRGGKVGIAPVPSNRLPGPLPQGLQPPIIITVQTDGALNFDRPAAICFPNLPDPVLGTPLAAGSKQALISFNHKKGIWEAVANMTVSADGKFVCTDPGEGIQQPGWHGVGPLPSGPPGCQILCCPDAGDEGSSLGALSVHALGSKRKPKVCKPKPCTETKRQCEGECFSQYLICNAEAWRAQQACGHILHEDLGCGNFPRPNAETDSACNSGMARCERLFQKLANPECEKQQKACKEKCKDCPLTIGIPVHGVAVDPLEALYLEVSSKLAQMSALFSPFTDHGLPIPEEVWGQVEPLLRETEALAGGDIEQFLNQFIKSKQDELAAAGSPVLEEFGNAPAYPILYMAEIVQGSKTVTLRGQTEAFGQYSLFVPRNARLLSVSFYDPLTKGIAVVYPPGQSSSPYPLPRFVLRPLDGTEPDADHDVLADSVELIYGTDLDKADSDGDGIPDGAEVEQGTNPLDGFVVRTGVIATAKTPGAAIDIWTGTDVAVTAEGTSGISIFPIYKGVNPIMLSHLPIPGNAQRLSGAGNTLVIATPNAGLFVVDITSPSSPSITRQVNLAGARSVVIGGTIAYAGATSGTVIALDLLSGEVLTTLTLGTAVQDLALEGDYLYALTGDKLFILSLADDVITVLGSVASPFVSTANERLFVGGKVAYAVHGKGYNAIDVSDPAKPLLLSAGKTTQFGWRQIVANGSGLGFAAVGPNRSDDGAHNVSLYDLSDPKANDVVLTTFPTPGLARAVSIYNGLGYVADDKAGLEIVNFLAYDNKRVVPTIKLEPSFGAAGLEEGKLTRVSANVTDDVQVRNVEFYVEGEKQFTDGAFPFEFRFISPVRSSTRTSFHLRARAIDTGGNFAWSDELVVPLVADITPPRVVKVTPLSGGKTVSTVLASFNEPLNPDTLNSASFWLAGSGPDGQFGTADDVAVSGTAVSFVAASRTAILTLSEPLPNGRYRATLTTAVADLAGNPLAADYSWQFQVGDANFWVKTSDGLWTDPLNWSEGRVPQPNENVIIDVPGPVTVTVQQTTVEPRSIQVNNRLLLVNSTIKGSAITRGAGGSLAFSPGQSTFEGVTIEGDLDLTAGGNLRIRSGLTLMTRGAPGATIRLSGGTVLGFEGDQTFNAGVVEFIGTGISFFGLSGATVLTLGPDVLIHGRSGSVGQPVFNANGTQSLINKGTIKADVAGGTLTVNPDLFQNSGTVSANGGNVFINAANWSSSQTLTVATGVALTLAGQWSNTGLIQVDGGVLNLDYTDTAALTLAKLGQLSRTGGAINLACTFDNSNGTLALNAATGPWVMAGGRLRNGTVTQSEGAKLQFGQAQSVLDGVALEGDLDLSNGGSVKIQNGLTLLTQGAPGGTIRLSSGAVLGFEGDQTFGPGNVEFSGINPCFFGLSGATTLTLGTGVVIHGRSGSVGQPVFNANGTQSLINQGTIIADVASGIITINPDAFQNAGSVSANPGTVRVIAANWSSSGTVAVAGGGTLTLSGQWSNSGSISISSGVLNLDYTDTASLTLAKLGQLTRTGGTVNLTSTLDNTGGTFSLNAQTGSWLMNGGTIKGGVISQTGGAKLQFTGGQGVLDGVTVDGDLDLNDGGSVRIRNGLRLATQGAPGGTVRLGAGAILGFEGDQTFGPANVEFSGASPSYFGISGATTLTLAKDVTVHGRNGSVGQPVFNANGTQNLINEGIILADAIGGTITINPDQFQNAGTVSASAGIVNITAATWSSGGTLAVTAGASLRFAGQWSNTGLINLNGGVLNVDYTDTASLTLTKLGQLNRSGGTLNLGCTLDLTGTTLALNAQTGTWIMAGAKIKGGTVSQSAGAKLQFSGARSDLEGVTVDGDLDLSGGGSVRILNGLTLTAGSVPGGSIRLGSGAVMGFEGDQSFGPGTVEFVGTTPSYFGISAATTLTVKNSVLIHGRSGSVGQPVFNANGIQKLVNEGTISADVSGGTITVNPDVFVNNGTTTSANGGKLNLP